MDLQATLDALLEAYLDDDVERFAELRQAYIDWRRRGGFEPTPSSRLRAELILGNSTGDRAFAVLCVKHVREIAARAERQLLVREFGHDAVYGKRI
jgi:hypothetical protein